MLVMLLDSEAQCESYIGTIREEISLVRLVFSQSLAHLGDHEDEDKNESIAHWI